MPRKLNWKKLDGIHAVALMRGDKYAGRIISRYADSGGVSAWAQLILDRPNGEGWMDGDGWAGGGGYDKTGSAIGSALMHALADQPELSARVANLLGNACRGAGLTECRKALEIIGISWVDII